MRARLSPFPCGCGGSSHRLGSVGTPGPSAGHGFGVPSPDEVLNAWERTRTSISRLPLGGCVSGKVADYPLPGLPELFSAVAAHEITPDTLLSDTSARILKLLGG